MAYKPRYGPSEHGIGVGQRRKPRTKKPPSTGITQGKDPRGKFPRPPVRDPLMDQLNAIFGPQQQYITGLINSQQSAAGQQAAELRARSEAYAKWYSGHVPQQISGMYSDAANQTAGFAKGFSDGMQVIQNQTAHQANDIMSAAGSPQGQMINPGPNAADVLYGQTGFYPASSLAKEGAAFGSAAALMPGAIVAEGNASAQKIIDAAAKDITKLEGQLISLQTKAAQFGLTISESRRKERVANKLAMLKLKLSAHKDLQTQANALSTQTGTVWIVKGNKVVNTGQSTVAGGYLTLAQWKADHPNLQFVGSAKAGYRGVDPATGTVVTTYPGTGPDPARWQKGPNGSVFDPNMHMYYRNGKPYLPPVTGSKGGGKLIDPDTGRPISDAEVNSYAKDTKLKIAQMLKPAQDKDGTKHPPLKIFQVLQELYNIGVPFVVWAPIAAKKFGINPKADPKKLSYEGVLRLATFWGWKPTGDWRKRDIRPEATAFIEKTRGKAEAAATGGVAATTTYGFTRGSLAKPLPGMGQAGSWGYADPEGQDGRHMAIDWFAPSGTSVVVPEGGIVIEARYDPRSSGQIFGGTVKVRTSDGRIWVFRHTNPAKGISVGMKVPAGTPVGLVAPWSGSTHSHVELWRTEGGGYHAGNMINPLTFLYGNKNV